VALRFLDDDAMAGLFRMPADMKPVPVDINRLDDQTLVRYYEGEWRRWQ
jgi:spermidine synthase